MRFRTPLGVGMVAAAVVSYEVALTRIFSFRIWHHFAFMVLSVALLGTATSGVLLDRFPALGTKPASQAASYARAFGLSAVAVAFVVGTLSFDPATMATSVKPWLVLLVYYFALAVPFTFAGLAIVVALNARAPRVGSLYAADLAGAGLGAAASVFALAPFGADGLVWLVAALALLGAGLLSEERSFAWASVTVVLALVGVFVPSMLRIEPGPSKALAGLLDAKRFPNARVIDSEWNAISRIDVVEKTGKVSWTSRANHDEPPQSEIVIDGDAATPIIEYGGDRTKLAFLDDTLGAAAYLAFAPKHVLVIGAGGGVDVLTALRGGAERVDAVEVNPSIVRLMTGALKDRSSSLFERSDVTLIHSDGRAFVERSTDHYDAIQISLVDTWAATSQNAYSLAESHLYTLEAFTSYLQHLEPNGVLTMTRWAHAPPRETLRLCVIAARALDDGGWGEAADRIVMLGNGQLANMLVKRAPFTASELATLRNVADAFGYHFVYAPGIVGHNTYTEFFRSPNRADFVANYPYDVSVVTDDRPYFFQVQRWRDTKVAWGDTAMLSGRVVVLAVLVQSLLASALLLGLSRRSGIAGSFRAGVYFALIGVGFMFFEVALVQHATLLLGSATYALALALATLLCAAGIGSLFASQRAAKPRLALALAGVLSVASALVLHGFTARLLAESTPVRVLALVVASFPVAVLMGTAFPSGVSTFKESNLGRAWAINGCASVIGPILAALIAMDVGVTCVMVACGVCYALAAGLLRARLLV